MDETAGGSTPGNSVVISSVTYYEKGRFALDIRPIDPPSPAPGRGPPGARRRGRLFRRPEPARPVAALAALLPLLLFGPSPAAAQEEARVGDFVYVREIAYRSGADRSHIFVPDTVSRIGLRWKCTREGLRLQLVPATRWLGEEPRVEYRVDEDEPRGPEAWRGGRGEWVYAPREVTAHLKVRAADADSLHLLIHDYRGREVEASFGVTGFTEAIRKLSCAR